MASKLTETKNIEATVASWLSQMGWEAKSSDDLKVYNRPMSNPIVERILIEKVMAFNNVSEAIAQQAVDILTSNKKEENIIINENFLNKLKKGVAIKIDDDNKTIQFIDFDDIWQNSFIITRQYFVQGAKLVKPDIVLLVNGIPLIAIEAKQCARKGTNWMEGVAQFSTYAQRCEGLYWYNLFGVACNGRMAKYGIPGASASYFMEWKDNSIDTILHNPILDDTNHLVETYIDDKDGRRMFKVERLSNGEVLEKMRLTIIGLLQPIRVLDILQHFIVFERDTNAGKIIKKVARYQQLRAANKITKRVVTEDLKQGVIWHTQGSGKSLTMVYTAQKLVKQPELNDPTIYIVVDRKELKEQIGGTFIDCVFPNATIIPNIGKLKSVIKDHPSGVYISTVQKFSPDDLKGVKDERGNVIVMIDEAHRTEYGDYQMMMKAALPNAKRFAFTGTPIPKTHKEFGIIQKSKAEFYLDKYSIQDAIDDGATCPIVYTLGPVTWQLDKEKLKQGYEDITKELDDDQKRLVELRVQPWKTFLKNPERIKIIAKDIAEDFREQVEPQGFKAQVVACDKEACVMYYNELLNYFDASEMKIVFSESNYETEDKYKLFSPFYLDDHQRKLVITNFKKLLTEKEKANGNNLKILIVCNMLLTGFDAPIEQAMYLDSPLRDHNLLQAVARTNRPYDNKVTKMKKEFGKVVDYVGVFINYRDALNYDPEDIVEFEDVDSLAKKFPVVLSQAFNHFNDILLEDTYECEIAILKRLEKLDQSKWEAEFHNVVQFWESISPNPLLLDYRDKYLWLCNIYELYLEQFRRTDFESEIYAAKTRKLIHECTHNLKFGGHLPKISIDSNYLNELRIQKLEPSDKAEMIIRDIETMIKWNSDTSVIYVEFQERLDKLVNEKNANIQNIEEILQQLSKLYTDLDEVAELPKKMGFESKGQFEIFLIVKNKIADEKLAKDFAIEAHRIINGKIFIGWHEMPSEVRKIMADIQLLAADDKFSKYSLYADNEVMEQLQNTVTKFYSLS